MWGVSPKPALISKGLLVRSVLVCTVIFAVLVSVPVARSAGASVNYPPMPRGPNTECLGTKHTSPSLTATKMAQIEQTILAEGRGGMDSVAPCPGGPVVVQLRPGRERLARKLEEQYGSKVAIFVGLTAWHGRPGRSPVCGPLPAVPEVRHDVALSLRLDEATVTSGSDFTGTVTLLNNGPGLFEADIGQPLQAVLVRVGSNRVVGVYTDGIAGTGLPVKLAPGHSKVVAVVGGTARCDGGVGSPTPPGLYGVTVLVRDDGAFLPGQVSFSAYVSLARPLRVVAAKEQSAGS